MFYGWKIVGVSFTSLFISVGFLFYSYSVFFSHLEAEFGSSRFGVALGLVMMNLTMAILSPWLGKAVDKYSIRNIMVIGSFLMGVGFIMVSQISALWQFYLILATILGLGEAMVGMLPSQTLIANWFLEHRGIALGIATMGISLSGMVMAPVTTILIEQIGWRNTFVVYGIISIIVVAPLSYRYIRNRPEDMGLYPDGESAPDALPGGLIESEGAFETEDQKAADALEHHRWTFRELIKSVDFWAIVLTFSMIMHCNGAVLTNMVPMARDRGLTAMEGAMVLSLSAGMAVLGKLVFGWIADHIDTRIAVWISIAFQFMGAIFFLQEDSILMMRIAGASFGFGMGGVVPLWGSLIGEVFGRENFGTIMGSMSPCMVPISMTGLPLAAYIFDVTGSYTIAFRMHLVIYVIAALCMFLLKRRDVDQRIKRGITPTHTYEEE